MSEDGDSEDLWPDQQRDTEPFISSSPTCGTAATTMPPSPSGQGQTESQQQRRNHHQPPYLYHEDTTTNHNGETLEEREKEEERDEKEFRVQQEMDGLQNAARASTRYLGGGGTKTSTTTNTSLRRNSNGGTQSSSASNGVYMYNNSTTNATATTRKNIGSSGKEDDDEVRDAMLPRQGDDDDSFDLLREGSEERQSTQRFCDSSNVTPQPVLSSPSAMPSSSSHLPPPPHISTDHLLPQQTPIKEGRESDVLHMQDVDDNVDISQDMVEDQNLNTGDLIRRDEENGVEFPHSSPPPRRDTINNITATCTRGSGGSSSGEGKQDTTEGRAAETGHSLSGSSQESGEVDDAISPVKGRETLTPITALDMMTASKRKEATKENTDENSSQATNTVAPIPQADSEEPTKKKRRGTLESLQAMLSSAHLHMHRYSLPSRFAETPKEGSLAHELITDAQISSSSRLQQQQQQQGEGLDGSFSRGIAATDNTLNSSTGDEKKKHWSIFYEKGMDEVEPPSVHYLHLGSWCTITCDYWRHREPTTGEVRGHRVLWLHTALPHDKFVFLVEPVEKARVRSLWRRLFMTFYGTPPAFAYDRGRLLWNAIDRASSSLKQRGELVGVEAIEVSHGDITALDYCPGLTSSRLAFETKNVTMRWFDSRAAAFDHYQIEQTWAQTALDPYGHPQTNGANTSCSPALTPVHYTRADAAKSSGHTPLSAPPALAASRYDSFMLKRGGGKPPGSSLTSPPMAPLQPPPGARTGPRPASEPPLGSPRAATESPPADSFRLPKSTVADTFPPLTPKTGGSNAAISDESSREPSVNLNDAFAREATGGKKPGIVSLAHNTNEQQKQQRSFDSSTSEGVNAANNNNNESPQLPPDGPSNNPEESFSGSPTSGGEEFASEQHHSNTMVIIYSQDPHFNAVVREALIPEDNKFPYSTSLAEQKRLMSLYEAGIPSWCIFLSRWGLPYRRWFRLIAVALINIWPIIALFVGLYDLYKHMPYLKEFLADQLRPMTEWLDNHFTVRISILLTYLFTVSFTVLQSLHAFIRSLMSIANFVLSPFYPLFQLVLVMRYPLLAAWSFIWYCVSPFVLLFITLWKLLSGVAFAPFRFFVYTFSIATRSSQVSEGVRSASLLMMWWRNWLEFWDKVARPIKNLAKACYDGVVHVGMIFVRREVSIRRFYLHQFRRLAVICEMIVFWASIEIRALMAAPLIIQVIVLLTTLLTLFLTGVLSTWLYSWMYPMAPDLTEELSNTASQLLQNAKDVSGRATTYSSQTWDWVVWIWESFGKKGDELSAQGNGLHR